MLLAKIFLDNLFKALEFAIDFNIDFANYSNKELSFTEFKTKYFNNN